HLRAALALEHSDQAWLHEALGGLHTVLGEYAAALQSFETAITLAGPEATARLEQALGKVYARRGDWELAAIHFEAAIGDTNDQGLMARAYADWRVRRRVWPRARKTPVRSPRHTTSSGCWPAPVVTYQRRLTTSSVASSLLNRQTT